MAPDEVYREANRRTHKLLGTYLALWAWSHKVDCVGITRLSLFEFLGLSRRMQNKRVEWLKEDVKHLFSHAWTTVTTASNVYATLYLSRFKFPDDATVGSMSEDERVAKFTEFGLKTRLVEIPKEKKMVRDMATIVHGISDFA